MKTKALVTDLLSTLNLHTVFLVLTSADQKVHQAVLENLNDEVEAGSIVREG